MDPVIALLVVGIPSLAILLLAIARRLQKPLRGVGRVLLLTAHPDDEVMFFAPTILGLLHSGSVDVHLLCLSNGDHKGQGAVRKGELRMAIRALGLVDEALTIVEHSSLPDHPDLVWDRDVISGIVSRHVDALDIDCLITFDEGGVSGHSNHVSLFDAVEHLYTNNLLPPDTQVFLLNSVSLVRKYLSLWDLPISLVICDLCYISDWEGIWRSYVAMQMHASQLVWFRRLYMLFSRYVVMNTLRRIAIQPDRSKKPL